MLTCPNCLKRYKSLSRHLYSSSCIAIKSKQLPHKRVYMSKHNRYLKDMSGTSICDLYLDQDNVNILSKNDYEYTNSIIEEKHINYNIVGMMNDIYNSNKYSTDTDKLIEQYQRLNRNKSLTLDPNLHVWIELLQILQEINAPLNAFNKIMKWAVKSKSNGYQFNNSYPSRKSLLKQLKDLTCGEKLQPIPKKVSLSGSESTVVTTFDFEQMCFSLLTDNSIMRDENFTFAHDDPRTFERLNEERTNCIEDGLVYQNTAKEICKQEKDFCLGIKLFIDATHTDVHSNWVLDPVMFTFTFLKNHVTRQHNAWRPIGFINNQGKMSTAESQQIKPRTKLQDFHTQLQIIFESVRECQQKGGFNWNLKHKNVVYPTRMFPVIILIVGDAQGNHKLCGMYNSFYGTSRVNHSCDCPWNQTDDENIICNFVPHQYIKALSEKNRDDELNALSQHNIINAFDQIVIGNHPAGLNAIMPAEILHQMFLGVVEYTLSGFVNLYSKKGLSRLDKYGRSVYPISIHNSDRNIPNLSCQYGFTSLTRQKGSDRVGLCLTILLCLSSDVASIIAFECNKYPNDRIRNMYRSLFEDLLLYMEWLSKTQYDRNTLDAYNIKIKSLMTKMKLLVRRENNKGLKVGKFHEMLHVIRDIKLFGPPCGFDGRPGESSHKDTKKCAVKTQRRKDIFEYQTGYRIYENLLVSTSASLLLSRDKNSISNVEKTIHDESLNITSTSHYCIYKNETGQIIQTLLKPTHANKTSMNFHQLTSDYIYRHLSESNITGFIQCRTFLKLDDNFLIRSTPSYNKVVNSVWYDWVWINWEYENGSMMVVPGQIYSIVDLRSIDINKTRLKKGFYICIKSISKVPTPKWKNSRIIHSGSFETDSKGNQIFRLVHVENIVKSCYAIPDFDSLDYDANNVSKWLFVTSKDQWSNLF